jgi:CubicO group peptidase (beta-lactamase class C family)
MTQTQSTQTQNTSAPSGPKAGTAQHARHRLRVARVLLGRDSVFARRRSGKVLIALILFVIPVFMLFWSLRAGRYTDNSWQAVVMAAVLLVGYIATRRPLVTVTVGVLTVIAVSWLVAPDLASDRTGDPTLLAQLDHERSTGRLAGLHDVAVAQIDLGAHHAVRVAGLGADETTPMEIGSITKAMTGLVIADAVARGEVRMDVPVSTYLPQLAGSRAGTVTLHELVTHSAGYAEFGPATKRHAAWTALFGQNFIDTDLATMTREVRGDKLTEQGYFVYSSLGAAVAGQAVAAATGMTYPDLMRSRLFEPLEMTHTAIQTNDALVTGGTTQTGLPTHPWLFDAYAPAGAAVSTTADLAKLAGALLDGTAPGIHALDPTDKSGRAGTRIGDFWMTTTDDGDTGDTITWHNGQTGGYTSYLGLDREHHRAVVVLSDVATSVTTDLGTRLLTMSGR